MALDMSDIDSLDEDLRDDYTPLYFCSGLLAVLFLLSTLALTPAGLFTNHWASETNKNIYHDERDVTWHGIKDEVVYIFEVTAFSFIFVPLKCILYVPCCCDDWCAGIFTVLMMCYGVSAFFSFVGCLIHASQYSTSQLGYSFYLCLTPGILLLLFIVFFIILQVAENQSNKVTVKINTSSSVSIRQSVEPSSVSHRQAPMDARNVGTSVFAIMPAHGQVSGRPPAYNEVPGIRKFFKKPNL
ncbi:uncharacterized protein LOC123562137 [Mercenaria mercenaria]|uniref:uncharacterized protein LOC123562137 n=1 Tax=Mercenaria mercenaria TaxID=6596 RepID=UPI00234F893A|nr:uncharacterized protein LOC123562137 [Mercenaria mercenaria]